MVRWRRGSLVINPAMYRRKAPALPGLGVLAATSELFKFMLTQGAPRVLEARHFGGDSRRRAGDGSDNDNGGCWDSEVWPTAPPTSRVRSRAI
jgi:hypothetical protein